MPFNYLFQVITAVIMSKKKNPSSACMRLFWHTWNSFLCMYFWEVCCVVIKKQWVMTLPAKLMYGILFSTAGVSLLALSREMSSVEMVFLLDKQTGAHKSNMYFKKICLFSLQWLFLLSSVNTWCNLLSTATEILHFSIHLMSQKEQPPNAQRRMTKTMHCGSFGPKSWFSEVLRQQRSLRCQVQMSPCECWIKWFSKHKAD